ncbi:hypothetical protein IH992_19935 [Candidatus Poribacteria bacterium]|nr:hypothetical protein [Candidatus Poribacteria bacterium]
MIWLGVGCEKNVPFLIAILGRKPLEYYIRILAEKAEFSLFFTIEPKWGAVLTRGGYLVSTWGDADYRYNTASLASRTYSLALQVFFIRLKPEFETLQ